jgi:NADPH:quinone reductase
MTQGDRVLINAASSSVGLAAIELANIAGATPIAATRDKSKAERLLQAGAQHVIVTREEDIAQRLANITAGQGVNLVFDAVAGEAVAQLAGATAFQGRYIIYGALSGEPTPLPIGPSFQNHLTFRTFTLDPARIDQQPALDHISAAVTKGTLRPKLDRVFEIENIVEAFEYLESNRQFGKIVVTV